MKEAPQVAEWYKKNVATNSKVDMVYLSFDKNASGQSKFIGAGPFSFGAVKLDAIKDRKAMPTVSKHIQRAMPWYVLVDQNGKEIVEGDTDLVKIENYLTNLKKK